MDAVRAAWEAFQDGGDPAPPAVSPVILASWQRSRALEVPPDLRVGRPAPRDTGGDGPTAELFARAGTATIRGLARELGGTGCVLVAGDATGTVLARAGDRDVTARTDAAQMVPGAWWTERAAGTNGIGLALALARPAQVVGEEHFCAGWHGYGCTSAPVRHPVTGEVLGGLTLITRAHVHDRPVVAALVRRAAREAEHTIGDAMPEADALLAAQHVRGGGGRGVARLTVDRRGRVVLHDDAAMALLRGSAGGAVLAIVRAALADGSDSQDTVALPGAPARACVRVLLVRRLGEVAGAVVTVDGVPPRGAPATLRDLERDAIARALDETGGNVAAAAETLGISRATLYRRLRSYRVLGRG